MSHPKDESRRGVEALEFALILPVLLLILSGIVDFGWYYYQEMSMQEAVRQAARSAATEPRDGDPVGRAIATAEARMQGMPYTPEITVTLPRDSTGEVAVRVSVTAEYVGLWAMLNLPWQLEASATMRLEDQPEGAS